MSESQYTSPDRVDPAFAEFLELFNRGEFWTSHEALEGAWRETGSQFYHALILFASAFVHVKRGNRHGIASQLAKADPLLQKRTPHYLGIDVEGMVAHSAICRHLVAENRDAPGDAWPVIIPIPRIDFDAALVRGDEPELERRSDGESADGNGAGPTVPADSAR